MYVRKKVRRYQPRPRRRAGADAQDTTPPPERLYVSYAVVESYRDELGQPRQRTVLELGAHPSLQPKLAQLEARAAELATRLAADEADPARQKRVTFYRGALGRVHEEIARLELIATALGEPSRARGAPERQIDRAAS